MTTKVQESDIRSQRAVHKVVHLTSSHGAKDTRIWRKECVSLAKAGYDVTLIAPHKQDETAKGVTIRSVPQVSVSEKYDRFLATPLRLYLAARKTEADVFHFHDPEFLPYAMLLRARGIPVVQDVHENTSQSIASRPWIPRYLRKIIGEVVGYFERFCSRSFSAVIGATPFIANQFNSLNKNVWTIQNYPILESLVSEENSIPHGERPGQIAYIGSTTEVRGIREMIKAVSQVAEHQPVELVLAGSFGRPKLREELSQTSEWEVVDFRGWVEFDEVADILANSRLGLVVFHPEPNHIYAQPNKLFEYMASGLPVVASDFPLWRDIVGGNNCGILVDPEKVSEIAEAITWILNHPNEAENMGRRGRKAVEDTYRWSEEKSKLIELYDSLLL